MNVNRVFQQYVVAEFIEFDDKVTVVKRILSKGFFSSRPACHGTKCDSNHLHIDHCLCIIVFVEYAEFSELADRVKVQKLE